MRGGRGGGFAKRPRWYENPAPEKVNSIQQVYYPPRSYYIPTTMMHDPSAFHGSDDVLVPSIMAVTSTRCPPAPQVQNSEMDPAWKIATDAVKTSMTRGVSSVKSAQTGAKDAGAAIATLSSAPVAQKPTPLQVGAPNTLPMELRATGNIRAVKRRRVEKPLKRGSTVISVPTATGSSKSRGSAGKGQFLDNEAKVGVKRGRDGAPAAASAGAEDELTDKDEQDDMDDLSSVSNGGDDDDMDDGDGGDDEMVM